MSVVQQDTNTSKHIVFLDQATFPDAVRVRPPAFPHSLETFARTTADQIVERARDAEIIILNKVAMRAETLAQLPKLKMIAVAATGTDNIDLNVCKERGIFVSNIRGYAIATVPEHTMGLMLSLSRSIRPYHVSVAKGRWGEAAQFCYFDYPIFDLKGKVLGIIGDGVLGKSIAKLGEAYTPFERILSESDVITMHCPLTDSTRNLLGPAEFDQMKKQPLVLNTARGGLVDERALVDALKADKIAGAAFDVVTTEPIPDDHPFLEIIDQPNFILTPHVAWASIEAIQGLADQMVDNIDAYVAGQPRNVV
jgi:glycerate dehydrogenase